MANKNKKIKGMEYLRTAVEKYERLTKKHLSANAGIVNIAKAILGYQLPKAASWNFLICYCDGEKLITGKERQLRNKLRKENPINDIYTKEKAIIFYQSREWRKLRVDVIEEQKGRCQMCGRSYKIHGVTIHVDHIVPISIDWSRRLDKTNLQVLCEDCNLGKSNRYSTDWRKVVI
jgi:5-methylcytosine-specific restriction endonuclease McrA